MFVPRKQSSKRRVRTHSNPNHDLNENGDKEAIQTSIQTLKVPSPTPALARASPSKAVRPRLRPTPLVPGYEKLKPATVNEVPTSRYSTEELENLRLGTASAASLPTITAAVERKAEGSVQTSLTKAKTAVTTTNNQSASVLENALAVEDEAPPSDPDQVNEILTDTKSRTVYRCGNTAEPFSKQWDVFGDKDELFKEQNDLDESDGPVVVESSKVEKTSMQLNSGQLNSGSDSEQAREDSLWQRELLQRAGVSATTASRLAQSERDRHDEEIIREMDLVGCIGSSETTLQAMVDELEGRCEAAAKDVDGNCGKLERIQQTVYSCKHRVEEVRQKEQQGIERAKLYEDLQGDLEMLCRELRRQRKRMVSVRERRIDQNRKRGEAVEEFLRGGVDEYGRVRRAGTGARWIEYDKGEVDIDNEVREIVKDMPVGLRSVYDVMARVTKWKELFGQDYEQVLGDLGIGRVVGALATCERNLDWVADLSDCQRRAALNVCGGTDEVEMFVRAEWRPSDRESCERVGKIVGYVTRVMDDDGKMAVVDVVRRRMDLEVSACDTSGDRLWREDVEKGLGVFSQWVEIGEIEALERNGVSV